MEEIDIALITKRSIHGVLALISRTFFIQIVAFASNLLLTIFLTPAVFGIYFIVSAAISFLSYFSDIGLAAALIQKKESITDEELQTTFTIQELLVIVVVVVALFLSGTIGVFYHLNKEGIMLFQALAIGFFLSSLKTIPSIILERNLRFEKLVIPQIVETLFFSVVAAFFAIKGFGIMSFTYAVLARGISGLVAMFLVAPWRVRFGFSKDVAKRLLSFGVPFQMNSFLALLKDDLLIAYIGKVLPTAQVGYIGFAQKWAFMPLRLIMDNVIRITFPSFSRLQHEKEILGKAIEKSLFATSFLIFPSLVGLLILAPYFIHIIPRYEKWEPALFSLSFFAINAGLSSVSTPLTNALNAIGKIKISLFLMVFWTITTWVLTPLGILFWGFNGVSIVSSIIALSVGIVIFLVKREISFNAWSPLRYQLIASCVMGVFVYMISLVAATNLLMIFLVAGIGAAIYFGIMYVFSGKELLEDWQYIRKSIKA